MIMKLKLSNREIEIMNLLVSGFTSKEIAEKLNISVPTVISHRQNIKAKLKCKNCPQLIYKAMRLGIIK